MGYVTRNGFEKNEESWKYVYTLTEKAARAFIWDKDERADFVSDVLLKHIEPRWDEIFGRPENKRPVYIYRAVRWAFLKKIRREKRQPILLEDDAALEFLPRAEHVPDPARAVEAENALVKAFELAGLSGYEQDVYLLRHVEGWSYAEIAEHLGTSKAAIRTAICRAKQGMKEFLAQQGNLVERV
jgi:RNA polymerase sigma-70 factor (ECF subfamily)